MWRPEEMIIPEGCHLNPRLPNAMEGRGVPLSLLMDVLMRAEAKIVPQECSPVDEGADGLLFTDSRDSKLGVTVPTETAGWVGQQSFFLMA